MPKTASEVLWFLFLIGVATLVYEFVRNPTNAVVTYLRMQFLKALGWTEREVPIISKEVSADAVAVYDELKKLFGSHAALVSKTVADGQTAVIQAITALPPIPTPPAASVAVSAGAYNEVPVPAGMDLGQFTALGGAMSAIRGWLNPKNNSSIAAALAFESDAGFASWGPYFIQQLLFQTLPGTPICDHVRQYVAAHPEQVIETVTPEQEAAAVQATS